MQEGQEYQQVILPPRSNPEISSSMKERQRIHLQFLRVQKSRANKLKLPPDNDPEYFCICLWQEISGLDYETSKQLFPRNFKIWLPESRK